MLPQDTLCSSQALEQLMEALEAAVRARAQAEETARVQAWKHWIDESRSTSPGIVYRWIRGSGDAALQMVKTPSGEFTAKIAEMDEAIKAVWKLVNRCYETTSEPSVDKFMSEYRQHIRHSLDLWWVNLLKRLPAPFWDALVELLCMVERTGRWPNRVAEGFMSLVPKGEGGGDPMMLRPLTVLLQIYRIWAGVRMEDALHWQEQWIHPEAYGFRPHRGAIDAATVLALVVELAQVLKAPLVGAGTDYTKCFDLIPQAISMTLMEEQGIDEGVLRALVACTPNSSACSRSKAAWEPVGQPRMGCCRAACSA